MQLDDNITPLLNWLRTLEIRSAKVFRRHEPERIIYAGDATLNFDPLGSGALVTNIKLTKPYPISEMARSHKGYPVGKLVNDDAYLTIELIDAQGNIWIDEATSDVDHNLTMYDGLGEAHIGSHSLSTNISMNYEDDYVYQILLANRIKFDFPDFELTPGVSLRIDSFTSFTRLMLTSSTEISRSLARELTEALQTLTGCRLQWIFEIYQHGASSKITLWSVDKPLKERPLPAPIPSHQGAALIRFVQSFVQHHVEADDYVLHWHSIYNAWQVSLITAVLPLSVSVEALISKYFPNERIECEEVRISVAKAQTMIATLDVPEEHRSRLKSSIAYIGYPSVTQALRRIEKRGGLSAVQVQAYTKIRNRAAHGVSISLDTPDEMQDFMTKVFACLSLVYKLLLLHLRYEGPIHDQSQENFPIVLIPADVSVGNEVHTCQVSELDKRPYTSENSDRSKY